MSINSKYLALSVILFMYILTGCANDSRSSQDSTSNDAIETNDKHVEYLYTSEIIPFSAVNNETDYISNVFLSDTAVYFTSRNDGGENKSSNSSAIFSMSFDGTGLMELQNYTPEAFSSKELGISGSIDVIHIDNSGDLWVAESQGVYGSDLPEDFGGSVIRRLDNTGAEILSFDISNLSTGNVWVHALSIDNESNIYIASGASIYIMNYQGDLLFKLDNPAYIANFIRMSDGYIAFIEQKAEGLRLTRIDIIRRSWKEAVSLQSGNLGIYSVYSGTGDFLYLYNDRTHLVGVLEETGEHVTLLRWADSNLSSEDITGIMLTPDGQISAIRQTQLYTMDSKPVIDLILLTKTTLDTIPDKIILTLGTFDFSSSIRHAVEQFNKNSDTHSIQVIDYSAFNIGTDWTHGLLRLNTELIAGNAPDILDFRYMPINNYISQDFLLDLYPLLDADPEIGRDSLVESVLKAFEINGSLFRIVPSYRVMTIAGHPTTLGKYPGWNMDEFIDVLYNNPQANMPMGLYGDKQWFFYIVFINNVEDFIDLESGTASFDSDDFTKLLELSNKFPSNINWDNVISMHERFALGQQIMEMFIIGFGGVSDYSVYRALFGGDIVFKGFPTENRDGHAFIPSTNIVITSQCTDVDAAWGFVRLLLIDEYQRNFTSSQYFPVSRIVFEEHLTNAMNPPVGMNTTISDGYSGSTLEFDPKLSQSDVDALRYLIDNIVNVWNDEVTVWGIVSESATDFFDGRITAQDAARIIQSRVSIYLSEQR